MRTVVSSGRSHSWVLVNTGALPAWSFYNLWSTSTGLLLFWYEKCCYFLTVPSKLKLRIFPAASLRRKSLLQITICLWTLNSGPLKMEKCYLWLSRKESCCPSNVTRTIIGLGVLHVLPEILGTAFRGNKVALLFVRTINLDTEIVFSGKWKALRFITWVNLILYLCCNVFYCDAMYFGSGLKRKENLGHSYFPLLRHFIVLCCIKDWKHWKERG